MRNATAPHSGSHDRHRDHERSASRDDERSAISLLECNIDTIAIDKSLALTIRLAYVSHDTWADCSLHPNTIGHNSIEIGVYLLMLRSD